ncbi:unnamed protein product [Brassica rapa subsp. narinosa]
MSHRRCHRTHLYLCRYDDVPLANGCVSFTELTQADEIELSKQEISPKDTLSMPYSSGTTGLPNCSTLLLTHHKSEAKLCREFAEAENPSPNLGGCRVIVLVLPDALDALMLSAMRTGAAILIVPRFELNLVMELIQRYKSHRSTGGSSGGSNVR